ncbi:aminodeoxychorismate/anthranilate synthase component II [Candidatus Parcubacteria bacterium]|nr:aminodeoxychorismate/anthranilate synthase component II [Candidatus Parcubacteria bacterium]
MKLLLIDNYDSFTYNLLHLFAKNNDVDINVVRNDAVPIDDLKNQKYAGVIIGAGPGDPSDQEYFGENMKVIKDFGSQGLPILGICLGFQGIAIAYGATLKQAKLPQHGKTSRLYIHDESDLFTGVAQSIEVMRYHSLMINADGNIPPELKITAEVDERAKTVEANGREIMALKHSSLPIYGVQFHPESFATELGDKIASNFINTIKRHR